MRVYLDNNILVDIEEGKYKVEDFLSVPSAQYFYSDAHIAELLNGVDRAIPGLRDKRLITLNALCRSNFLIQDGPSNNLKLSIRNPQQAYENAIVFGFLRRPINQLAKGFSPNRSKILDELHWDAREVGNYDPNQIFDIIDSKLRASKYRFGIKEYLAQSEAYTDRTVYSSLFNLLDMVGYRKDKNNVARLYDASHAYYAQACDILVSNDTKMRIKTEAVYHYLNVPTRILDASVFLVY